MKLIYKINIKDLYEVKKNMTNKYFIKFQVFLCH